MGVGNQRQGGKKLGKIRFPSGRDNKFLHEFMQERVGKRRGRGGAENQMLCIALYFHVSQVCMGIRDMAVQRLGKKAGADFQIVRGIKVIEAVRAGGQKFPSLIKAYGNPGGGVKIMAEFSYVLYHGMFLFLLLSYC